MGILIIIMNADKRIEVRERYLERPVSQDLRRKMVFIGGPRQVGKTTCALSLIKSGSEEHPAYLSWDITEHKSRIMSAALPPDQDIVIFDEIHKYVRWRRLLKGLYDKYHRRVSFLVTGSARLDYYRKGGDSLQGRYHYYRLHPFSFREYSPRRSKEDLLTLLRYGGFPEPLFTQSDDEHRRWQRERLNRVVREDLRDLERVHEISLIEILLDELPTRVGSPLSLKNLREALEVSHDAIVRWVEILENLYVCFRIAPFGASRIRAVKKEQKLYFWDWSQVSGTARFENLVACQLLKYCHFEEDTKGYRMELRYIRDTDKREVDFVVLKERRPEFAVECKTGERGISSHIEYFSERTNIPYFYQVHLGERDTLCGEKMRILPFITFCEVRKMP